MYDENYLQWSEEDHNRDDIAYKYTFINII